VASSGETNSRLAKAAIWYAKLGWKVLPCYGITRGRCTCNQTHEEPKMVGKHPRLSSWSEKATDDVQIVEDWWSQHPDNNVGVYCSGSGFLVIDIDPRSGGPDSFTKLEEILDGVLPKTVEAITGSYTTSTGKQLRGRHLFYKCDPDEKLIGNLVSQGLKGIDIKHNGYVLVAPSAHFSGMNYEWVVGQEPWAIEMAEAPEELLDLLRKRRKRTHSVGEGDWSWLNDLEYDGHRVDIKKMLDEGIDEGSRAVDVYRLACALANKYGTDDASRQMIETTMIRFNAEKIRPPMELEGSNSLLMHVHRAIDFVSDNPKAKLSPLYDEEWQKRKAQEISENSRKGSESNQEPTALLGVAGPDDLTSTKYVGTSGYSFSEALNEGKSFEEAVSSSNLDVPKDPDAISEQDGGEPGKRTLTDTGNGRRLVDVFESGIRYTVGLGWFSWKEGYWKPDPERIDIQELAKRLGSIISSETVHYSDSNQQTDIIRWATQAKSNSRMSAAIENAKSDPRINVAVERWDKDENYLGVKNGVIDLKTGELLKNRPDLFITKRAPITYTRGQTNVRWSQFLDFATDGDKEFQEWLQRAAGYSLTGSKKYDAMFLVYGPPGSGKNTLVEALVKCLGTSEYAWPMDSSILSQDDNGSNSSDQYHWAMLRGRRVVWVDELPDSERMKENSVKKLTGSTEISARFPGERPFNFQSTAKLWITTNHRPIITDEAMWRRIRAVPMTKVPENPDPDLKEYIFDPEGALPAVLSWAVEGAIKLLGSANRDSLGTCKAVDDASAMYKMNEDRIGIFLDEETKEAEGSTVPIKNLYGIYKVWSDERGEKPMTQIAFTKKLAERGLEIEGTGSRALLHGRSQMPRSVQAPTEIDWLTANRFAKNI